ncbi:MAG: hypothetical protein ACRDU0_11925, partial [Mycobacterium sp.]
MTLETTASLDGIDVALSAATPKLAADDAHLLAVAVYRLLATGRPVSLDNAATTTHLPAERVRQVVRSWPAVFFDRTESVAGFWGLALGQMPHRVGHRGVDLYA